MTVLAPPAVEEEAYCAECDEPIRLRIDGPCRCCGQPRNPEMHGLPPVHDHRYLRPYEHWDPDGPCTCGHEFRVHRPTRYKKLTLVRCQECVYLMIHEDTSWHEPRGIAVTHDHQARAAE